MASQWDGVPWMIGGGVRHTVNVSRLLAYIAFNGSEGIVNPLDLEVRALATPAGQVRINPGACSILNRNPGVQHDAYAARLPVQDIVDIAPTGASQWRTDLIAVKVKNPFLAGENYPEPSAAEIAAGTARFVETYVYAGILTGTGDPQHPTEDQIRARIGTESALALATVAMPVSTAAVAQGFVKDQRQMASIYQTFVSRVAAVTQSVTINNANGAGATLVQSSVKIPRWATHVAASALVTGPIIGQGGFSGNATIRLGSVLISAPTYHYAIENEQEHGTMTAADEGIFIPAYLRGTTVSVEFYFQRDVKRGLIVADTRTRAKFDLAFEARPERAA